jgi:hypothetical protein
MKKEIQGQQNKLVAYIPLPKGEGVLRSII